MNLTNPEKLILVMLSELHEAVKVKNGTDTKFLQRAIFTDNTWAISWELTGIVGDNPDPTPPEVSEVVDILAMWEELERSFPSVPGSLKDKIAPWSNVRFPGFDGNNECGHLGIAGFLVEDMSRFSAFKGRDLNSHAPSLDGYRRMLDVYRRAGSPSPVSEALLVSLFAARRAP